MRAVYLFLIFLLFFLSNHTMMYGQKNKTYFDSSISTDSLNVPLSETQYYLPTPLFSKIQVSCDIHGYGSYLITQKAEAGTIDNFYLKYYSEFLYAMKEPLLFNKPNQKEIYRYTVLRSFHNPIVLRIEKEKDKYFLYYKTTDGKGGSEPGNLVINNKKEISEKDWKYFVNQIRIMKFQKMKRSVSFGVGGAEWILEGATTNNYYAVSKWQPHRDSSFYQAFLFLLKLTDLNIPASEIY